MATFLRSFNGDYLNVDHIVYATATCSCHGDNYLLYPVFPHAFKEDEDDIYIVPAKTWLDYLGVPEEEQAARLEADRE